MKINGLKKTVSELRKCPNGWGLLIGYNAKTNQIFTSDLCRRNEDWMNFADYEFSLGYFPGDYPVTMQDLADRVYEKLDYYRSLFINTERGKWADKALIRLS